MITRPGHNTGYKGGDPFNPCRKCWEKYSKPYSGPIVYSSWGPGPSNRQKPLRSSGVDPSPSLSRSISSIVNQVRNDLSSYPGSLDRRSFSSTSSQVYPSRNALFPPALPPRPRSEHIPTSVNNWSHSAHSRNGPPPPLVLQPGDPRLGGQLCWDCFGSGRTFGFLLLSERPCTVCRGTGRIL